MNRRLADAAEATFREIFGWLRIESFELGVAPRAVGRPQKALSTCRWVGPYAGKGESGTVWDFGLSG